MTLEVLPYLTESVIVETGRASYILSVSMESGKCSYCHKLYKKGTCTWAGKCILCIKQHYWPNSIITIKEHKDRLDNLLKLLEQIKPKDIDQVADLLEE